MSENTLADLEKAVVEAAMGLMKPNNTEEYAAAVKERLRIARQSQTPAPKIAPLSDRLNYAAAGSCKCHGDRDGVAAHDPLCHFRLFIEARNAVDDQAIPPTEPVERDSERFSVLTGEPWPEMPEGYSAPLGTKHTRTLIREEVEHRQAALSSDADITDALAVIHAKHGANGINAIAELMHAMGAEAAFHFSDDTFTPCDVVMQQCWEIAESVEPAKHEITDEAIDAFLDDWLSPLAMRAGYRSIVHAALAKFGSPALSDDTLNELRMIALTRDPSVYLSDARVVIQRGVK